jgi:hypothetical protein
MHLNTSRPGSITDIHSSIHFKVSTIEIHVGSEDM